ncbi:MAG: GNAT family N-acetyltransferase [Deltaproteobacteria bacterium]|jgi:putative acetyltransferase|nr:GNAT family N-acetyltransferase [Deltaproteobacteria bacterium]
MARVELLGPEQVELLVVHMVRLLRDDSTAEYPLSPRGRHRDFDTTAAAEHRRDRWSRGLEQAGWARAWGVFDGAEIVGHVELHAGEIFSERHRGTVGLGVQANARRRGYAHALMTALIAWAQSQPTIGWIDLGVFAHNHAAERLYRKLGFVEVARVEDRFRVDEISVTDVQMTLRVDD